MECADKTAEHMEMVAVKAGNHTHVADDIDWFPSKINCHCHWQFMNNFPTILNCLQGVILSQIGHPDKLYSLSSEEIRSLPCSVTNDCGKLL
jgi:hypothetical protein